MVLPADRLVGQVRGEAGSGGGVDDIDQLGDLPLILLQEVQESKVDLLDGLARGVLDQGVFDDRAFEVR
jgi:hypothetical protein